jgi:hypothetical protein
MTVMEHVSGTDEPSEIPGVTNREITKMYIDPAKPEHKVQSLTADIIYRYKTG